MKFVLVLIAIIGAVLADPRDTITVKVEQPLKDFYKALDGDEKGENQDNKVTETEFVTKIFAADLKANGGDEDGTLSEKEFTAWFKIDENVEKALFKEFDNNHDDKVTKEELAKDYNEFDVDDDKNLDRLEFIEAIVLGFIFDDIESDDADTTIDKTEWKTFFGKVDADKSGGVCIGELEKYLPNYPEDVLAKFFDELDDNDDGDLIMVELVLNFYAFDEDNDKTDKANLRDTEFRWSVSTGADGQIFEKLDTIDDDKNQLTIDEIFNNLNKATSTDKTISLDDMKAALYGVPEHSDLILFKDLDEDNDETISEKEVEKFVLESQFPPEDDKLSWVEFDAAVDADD